MQIPFKKHLLVALIASGALLQGCADDEKVEDATAEDTTMEEAAPAEEAAPEEQTTAEEQSTNEDMVARSTAPEDATATIVSPADGATVSSPVKVEFGISGMDVVPAGTEQENAGHHHLLIDVEEMPDMNMPLPSTDNIRHFGGGQTETEIELEPGTHTLQLLLGDHRHIPHEPPVQSEQITITVE